MSKGDRRAGLTSVRRAGDALLLVRVAAVAALVPAAMRLPLPRTTALIRPRPGRRPRRLPAPGFAEPVAAAVAAARIAGYPVVRQGRLTRAVILYWFLARAGLPGGDRSSPADGHAWVTPRRAPLLEETDPEPRFAVSYRIPT